MADHDVRDWRELCDAALVALAAQNTDDLLQVLQELDTALERVEETSPGAPDNGARAGRKRELCAVPRLSMRQRKARRALGNLAA